MGDQYMHSLAKISTYLSEKILTAPIKQLFEFWKIIKKKQCFSWELEKKIWKYDLSKYDIIDSSQT